MNIKTSTKQSSTDIPLFPEFVRLDARHQKIIEQWNSLHKPYSDYNFISLWSWDHENEMQISRLNGNMVIKFQGYQDIEDFFYSFLGGNQVDKTAKMLLEHLRSHTKPILRLIPDFVVDELEHPEDFIVTETRDDHDYIIAVKNLVELEGSHNTKKRNALKQFIRDNEHHLSVNELDLKKGQDIENVRNLLATWSKQVGKKGQFNVNEFKAINKILDHHHIISSSKLQIVGLHLGTELKAFSITEVLEENIAMWHYKKADRSVEGLGVALNHFAAKKLHEKGVTHINYEQDLGIEGLRQSKMASQPVYFLKKFSLELR